MGSNAEVVGISNFRSAREIFLFFLLRRPRPDAASHPCGGRSDDPHRHGQRLSARQCGL